MTKGSILTMVVLVAAVALVAPAASAQTTLNIQNGTVVGVWDNTVVIRDSSGVSRQFDVPPDFKVDVDGKSVSVKELRPGMHITAAVKTVNTPVVVQSKELRRDVPQARRSPGLRQGSRRHPQLHRAAGIPVLDQQCSAASGRASDEHEVQRDHRPHGHGDGHLAGARGRERDRRSRQGGGGEGGGR